MADTQQSKKTTRAERRAYWQSHIEGWKDSGRSKQAYCREHGLNPTSFYRWCGKLEGAETDKPRFVPLRLGVTAQGGYVVELVLATGGLVRVADGADPKWVSRLVRELDGSC